MPVRLRLILLWVVCVLVVPVLILAQLLHAVLGNTSRSLKMAVALDQCGNALLGGSEDETISSHAGRRMHEARWACVLCKFLDIFERDHCKKSIGV